MFSYPVCLEMSVYARLSFVCFGRPRVALAGSSRVTGCQLVPFFAEDILMDRSWVSPLTVAPVLLSV